jgi:hypothetical protein
MTPTGRLVPDTVAATAGHFLGHLPVHSEIRAHDGVGVGTVLHRRDTHVLLPCSRTHVCEHVPQIVHRAALMRRVREVALQRLDEPDVLICRSHLHPGDAAIDQDTEHATPGLEARRTPSTDPGAREPSSSIPTTHRRGVYTAFVSQLLASMIRTGTACQPDCGGAMPSPHRPAS